MKRYKRGKVKGKEIQEGIYNEGDKNNEDEKRKLRERETGKKEEECKRSNLMMQGKLQRRKEIRDVQKSRK